MSISTRSLTLFHALLNSKFGIYQGMTTTRLTCWLNKHRDVEDEIFTSEKSWCKGNITNQIAPKFVLMSLGADLGDRRTPIINYLHDPDAKVDKSIRRSAFKFILHNDELYRYRRLVAEVLGVRSGKSGNERSPWRHLWFASIGSKDEVVIA